MRKSVILLTAIIFLMACNQKEIDDLTASNSELTQENTQQAESINDMLASFNQIQENLREIKKREGILINNSRNLETDQDIPSSINEDIAAISQLMQDNEVLRNQLNSRLKAASGEVSELKKLVAVLNEELDKKNLHIEELNRQLQAKDMEIGALYFSMDSLGREKQSLKKKLDKEIDLKFKAYYAMGTKKELLQNGVITKEGGFLGLGKQKTLDKDFNEDYFSAVDMREQKAFLIYAKKAELLSKHPDNSFQFHESDNKVDRLEVLDVEAFWKASKYMVIIVEN